MIQLTKDYDFYIILSRFAKEGGSKMRELFRAMIDADKELPRTMVIAQLK